VRRACLRKVESDEWGDDDGGARIRGGLFSSARDAVFFLLFRFGEGAIEGASSCEVRSCRWTVSVFEDSVDTLFFLPLPFNKGLVLSCETGSCTAPFSGSASLFLANVDVVEKAFNSRWIGIFELRTNGNSPNVDLRISLNDCVAPIEHVTFRVIASDGELCNEMLRA